MTKPLHHTVMNANKGDLGFLWLDSKWKIARIGDEFDGLLEVEMFGDEPIALAEPEWNTPWWPVSAPPYEMNDGHRPTHLVRVMSGRLSLTTTMVIADPEDGKRLHRMIWDALDTFREGQK